MTEAPTSENERTILRNMPWIINATEKMLGSLPLNKLPADSSEHDIALLAAMAGANAAFSSIRTQVQSDDEARQVVMSMLNLMST